MKQSEVIEKFRSVIASAMIERYKDVLECNGRIQYKLYIWEDGEIVCQEGVQGDNAYLVPGEAADRELFYVTTISQPFFDPWDNADHSAPEDETEREKERAEIIAYVMDEYAACVDELIDRRVREAQEEEELLKYSGYCE